MSTALGFVGLGQMGMPIARRLLSAGHVVHAFDQRISVRADWEAAGGVWADSPRAVADVCPTVMVSLPTPEAVEAVVAGPEGLVHGRAIQVFVDLSTSGPQAAQQMAKHFAAQGVVVMDAPVSGGVAGAEQGTLAIMVSGPQAQWEALRPVLQCFGAHLFHVGDQPGQGHLMKLINNLLSTTALAATYEALSVGAKAGLDPSTMLDILAVSSGTNHAIQSKIPRYLMRDVPMGFSLDLSYKDVSLAVQAGEALCGPMRLGSVTRQIWHEAIEQGGPKQDYLQVVRVFEAWAGVHWAPPAKT